MSGAPASPDVAQAPRPVDVPKAQDAIRQVRTIGASLNRPVRLVDIRRTPVADLLRPADPANKVDAGILVASSDPAQRWKDDAPTRDFLANAQSYAQAEAVRGVGELTSLLAVTPDQLAKMTPEQVRDAAKAKGWVVEGKAGDAASQAKAAETMDYLVNAHEYAREQQVQQPGAVAGGEVTVDPALKADLSGLTAEARGTLLAMVAGGPARELLEDRIYKIDLAAQRAGGELSPRLRNERERLVRLHKQLQEQAGAVDKELIRLIGPENTTPEQQALGYDMQRHIYEGILKDQKQELMRLQAGGAGTGAEARALAKKMEATQQKIDDAGKAKEKLVKGDASVPGQTVEAHPELAGDLVVQYATEMVQNIQGSTSLTAKEMTDITENPVRAIQEQLSKAAEDPTHMQKLVDTHVVTAEQAKELTDLVKMTKEENALLSKEKRDKAKQIGSQLMAFLGLFAYVAYQKKKGAAQG